MPALEQPRLRSTITGHVDPDDPRWVWLYDQARITRRQMRVRREVIPILELFDGDRDLPAVQANLIRRFQQPIVPMPVLVDLVAKLDEALFLDGPRLQAVFHDFLRSPIRAPACVGAYEEEPVALREQLADLFAGTNGPGPIREVRPDGRVRGALIPHIDLHRGGTTYAHGFKEVVEGSDASLFVIIGTSHYSGHRFTLTRKDFATPLGVAETDKTFVDRLADTCGPSVFEDEPAHLPEHSIEFHVLFLQYCLERRRPFRFVPFRIVPLLVGSFADCIESGVAPDTQSDIARMIHALKQAEGASGERVCYLSSGDLAHIGPKFGDPEPVHPVQLQESRRRDQVLLQALADGQRDAFTRMIVDEADERRICGFPPTYMLMSVLEPTSGRLLHYDQYVEPQGFESVSFASLVLEKQRS